MTPHQYDDYQQRVIGLDTGHWLVLAPPGCGKTDILAARVDRALQQGIEPRQMLCLTFTNRASRGMRDRIEQSVGTLDDLFTGNLHSLCSKLLFEYHILDNSYSVIDEQDSADLLSDYIQGHYHGPRKIDSFANQCYRLQHLLWQMEHSHPKELQVERQQLSGTMVQQLCEQWNQEYSLQGLIEIYRNADFLLQSAQAQTMDTNNELLQQLAVAYWYQCYKEQHRLVDFSDLLLRCYEALVLQSGLPTYKWIQIDEVQDLNPLQLAIVDLLTDHQGDPMVLYLGDEQQAIFSFMGAKLSTLQWIKDRCEGKLLHLHTNYRSPSYLQEVFNTFAHQELGTDTALLPEPYRQQPRNPEDLLIHYSLTDRTACYDVAKMVQHYDKEQTTAILVSSNAEADMLSQILYEQKLPHFKISGVDLFATPAMQLLMAHLSVMHHESRTLSWSRLLHRLGLFCTFSESRRMVQELLDVAMLPSDLLHDESYIERFAAAMKGDVVIFDTETTGLDVSQHDIVQIAAFKLHDGAFVDAPGDRFNVIIRTDQPIPQMLGDIENPLIATYREAEQQGLLLSPQEGLQRFLDFAQGLPLIGHNVEYDYRILQYNLQRHCNMDMLEEQRPLYFDTLKVSRLLYPNSPSHKLKDLLTRLHLEGQNSHLADDDAFATIQLALHQSSECSAVIPQQLQLRQRYDKLTDRLRTLYGELYRRTYHRRYCSASDPQSVALIETISDSYALLLRDHRMNPIEKMPYLLNYLRQEFSHHSYPLLLVQQLDAYFATLSTLRESDLITADMGQDCHCFVSTVHKAKGLEFDNVIVFDVNDGQYPFSYNKNKANAKELNLEDARKLYVALTRSRKRLVLVSHSRHVSRHTSGNLICTQCNISPFVNCIAHLFDKSEDATDRYREMHSVDVEQRQTSSITVWRFAVTRIENHVVWGTIANHGDYEYQLDFAHDADTQRWAYLAGMVTHGSVVNLIRPHMMANSVWAELYIYEPDYLVDITSLASCMHSYGASSHYHWLKMMQRLSPNRHFLLGRMVGDFLDNEVFDRQVPYHQSYDEFFSRNKLDFAISAMADDFDIDDFDAQAQRQKSNIHIIFQQLMPTLPSYRRDDAVLEPTFLCQMLGLEGRMDYLQRDFTILLEQKSGKRDEWGGPGPQREHLVQLLLYRAILHYNYNMDSHSLSSLMLYSRYDDGLHNQAPQFDLLFNAIGIRNSIVARQRSFCKPGGFDFLDTFSSHQLRSDGSSFFLQYILPTIQNVLSPIQNATPLESCYFKRFLRFLMREQWIDKMGDGEQESYGMSSLWRLPSAEKSTKGVLLDHLTVARIIDPQGHDAKTPEGVGAEQIVFDIHDSDVASNFRRGDSVVLYSYRPYADISGQQAMFGERRIDQVCRTMVFIATIESIDNHQVSIRLRAPQSNVQIFLAEGLLWAIEPYMLQSAYASSIQGLHAFLSMDAHRRGWLLGTEEPRVDTTRQPAFTYDDPTHREVVSKALQSSDYFLVMGPPGTGKTSFALMNILREELHRNTKGVLLCAYTHQAVDEICSKVKAEGIDFVRLGSPSSVHPDYHPYLIDERLNMCTTPNEVSRTVASIPVVVATVSAMARSSIFQLKSFSLAIIDEASQLLEPQVLPLLAVEHNGGPAIGRFVMIGDHKQLSSIVGQSHEESAITDDLLLEKGFADCRHSLFERLFRRHGYNSPHTVMLQRQGRMHSDIQDFPSQCFYDGMLQPLRPDQHSPLLIDTPQHVLDQRRLLFFHVPQPQGRMLGHVNHDEARLIARLVWELYNEQGPDLFDPHKSIGVIVPYRMQIGAVRDAICSLPEADEATRSLLSSITIDTVERYQGSQRRSIIYGFTVREPQQLQFLTDNTFIDPVTQLPIDRKLNVAMTRAQERLIMVGNTELLSLVPLFRQLIQYVSQRHCLVTDTSLYLP